MPDVSCILTSVADRTRRCLTDEALENHSTLPGVRRAVLRDGSTAARGVSSCGASRGDEAGSCLLRLTILVAALGCSAPPSPAVHSRAEPRLNSPPADISPSATRALADEASSDAPAPEPVLASLGQGVVTPEQRGALLRVMAELLGKHYVFPETAASLGQKLIEAERRGDYAALSTVTQLTARLTDDLQRLAGDKHLGLQEVPSGDRSPAGAGPPPNADNQGYAESRLLEGNVGYVDLRIFAPAEVAQEAAGRAMAAVATADALVFDLRNNMGGAPSGVQYLCSYLFADKVHLNSLYWREGERTEEFWTLDEVRGAKRPNVPVFVLTSERTFSGAEEFAYNLQTRKRATIVGEVTRGGANPGNSYALAPGLMMRVPTGRAINPVTNTNWEGVGVQPEVPVDEEQALERALELARGAANLRRRSP